MGGGLVTCGLPHTSRNRFGETSQFRGVRSSSVFERRLTLRGGGAGVLVKRLVGKPVNLGPDFCSSKVSFSII